MTVSIFFWVLPAVYLCFAILFFWIGRITRDLPSARWAAIGFATAVVAIPVDQMRSGPLAMGFLLAVPLHWLIIVAMLNAFLARHGDALPWRLVLRVFAAGGVMIAATTWVIPAPMARMITVNIIVIALLHAGLLRLAPQRNSLLDRAIFWTVALSWLTYVGRMLVLALPTVDAEVLQAPIWSQYMILFYFLSGVTALLDGMLLAIAITMDVMAKGTRDSQIDPLTGVANRRYYDRLADDAARAKAFGAVLMIDLDHFRDINSRHGHRGGDQVLAEAAQRLAGALPDDAVLARMGGEEFCILLPDAAQADAVANRIVQLFAAAPIVTADGHVPVTISVGAAVRNTAAELLNDALRRADIALYAAKMGGRNRAMMADGAGPAALAA
jgi:diguanylate cyclase (GGDEF)-like protein